MDRMSKERLTKGIYIYMPNVEQQGGEKQEGDGKME